MPLARASELDRLLSCPGSLILPRSDRASSVAIDWGNLVHSWMETGQIPKTKHGAALGKRIQESQVDRSSLWPQNSNNGEFEVALALNVLTGKVMRYLPPIKHPDSIITAHEARENWKAAFDDQWVVGTLDYVGELLDGPWIDDLKTGRYAFWTDYKEQQSFYCLAWSLWHYGEIRDSRSTITHWTRYPIGNRPVRKGAVLTIDMLKRHQEDLFGLREWYLINKEKLDETSLIVGNQCTYCPSKSNCSKIGK